MEFSYRPAAAVAAVLVVLMFLAVGCAQPEEVAEDPEPEEEVGPTPGGTLVIGYDEEPDILDPHKTVAIASNFIMAQIGDGLVDRDPETGDFIPHLAEDWDICDDGVEVTFYLRDDVTFHSGEPFTAHHMKATYERAMEPGHESGGSRLGPAEDFIVVDDHTFKIVLEQPFGPLLINLAGSGYMHPIDPVQLEECGEDYGREPASTGAWKFDDWVSGDSITLVRNEDYAWAPEYYENPDAAYPERIQVRYIGEDATRMAALETGEIDVAAVAPTDIDRFKDNPDFQIFEYMREGVCNSLWFNHEVEPLDDVLVRRALAFGMDKEAIIEAAIDGHGRPAPGVLPPNMWGYWEGVEDIAFSYNPEKAGELLDEAGWTLVEEGDTRQKDGEPLEFNLRIRPGDATIRTAEMLQAQYADIGVDIEIETFEWGTLMEYLSEGRYDLTLIGYGSTDPDWLYRIYHSSQAGVGLNWVFLRCEEMDEVVENIRYTVDPDERMKWAEEGQRMAIERAHWAPIYLSDRYIAVNDRVQGFDINFRGTWLLHDVWFTDADE